MVLGSKGGTMRTQFMLDSYIPQIYKRRPGNFFNSPKCLFVMGSATCHLSDDIRKKFRTANTDVKYFDSGILNTHVNKPFKVSLKDQWEEWLDNGKQESTKSGKRRRASYEMVAQWIHKAWRDVATDEIIVRGFLENGYMGWSGKTSELHSKLRTTVDSRNVPREVLEEVDQFLNEMQTMEAEEITDVQDGGESDDEDEEVGIDIIEEPEPDAVSDNEINVVSDESEADEDASSHDNNESGEVEVDSGSSDDSDEEVEDFGNDMVVVCRPPRFVQNYESE